MGSSHIVVDGSNIATEGRSLPSLQQLLDAVDAVGRDQNAETVTVIVDATFGHRIDKDERDAYEDKISKGEIITPPAGVIGRGDAFILEVADRAKAVVLSNDSFQEFHGEYRWLFDEGRLLGGKHVPGVGWIFLDRSPVRGPASRKAMSDAKRKRNAPERGSKKASSKGPKKAAAKKSSSSRTRSGAKKAQPAKASTRTGGGKGKQPEPYNEPLPFIEFVGANAVGSVVEGEVETFSSHGAYVLVGDTRCYVALKSLGDPAPRSARDVLTQGEKRSFTVEAIDTPRRGIDLSLADGPVTPPATDAPDESDVPAVPATPPEPEEPRITEADLEDPALSVSQRRKLRGQFAAQQAADAEAAAAAARPARSTKKSATKKSTTRKKATTKKTAPKKRSTAKKTATTKKAAPKKRSTAKKSTAKKAATKKSTSRKKAAPAKKAAAKKATSRKKATTGKKAATKKTPAKKAASKKRSTSRRGAAKKSTRRSDEN